MACSLQTVGEGCSQAKVAGGWLGGAEAPRKIVGRGGRRSQDGLLVRKYYQVLKRDGRRGFLRQSKGCAQQEGKVTSELEMKAEESEKTLSLGLWDKKGSAMARCREGWGMG